MRNLDKLSIGIFGGSFNPAHDGHMHVASCGLRELALDRVWWITSKQNPLKNKQTEYDERADSIKSLGLKKRMEINHIEKKMNIQYSIQMIKALKVRSPNTKFIFLMGADNLSQFTKWKSWKEITLLVPIAVVARPGYGLKSQLSPTARYLSNHRLPEHKAHTLKYESPPTWTFITPPLNKNSSSTIRKDIANA